MPSETIRIRFSPDVDSGWTLARVAVDLAFDFATAYQGRQSGPGDSVGYIRAGYVWTVWWTKARAVAVRCEREVSDV